MRKEQPYRNRQSYACWPQQSYPSRQSVQNNPRPLAAFSHAKYFAAEAAFAPVETALIASLASGRKASLTRAVGRESGNLVPCNRMSC